MSTVRVLLTSFATQLGSLLVDIARDKLLDGQDLGSGVAEEAHTVRLDLLSGSMCPATTRI